MDAAIEIWAWLNDNGGQPIAVRTATKGVTGSKLLFLLTLTYWFLLFLRPKFAVPPHLRGRRGLIPAHALSWATRSSKDRCCRDDPVPLTRPLGTRSARSVSSMLGVMPAYATSVPHRQPACNPTDSRDGHACPEATDL